MTGFIIYGRKEAEKNSWFINQMIEYAKACGIELKLLYAQDISFGLKDISECIIHNGNLVRMPDFVINRSIFPLLSEFFEKAGVRVFNNSMVSNICNDKRKTHLYLANKGIPMMDTLFFDRRFFDYSCKNIEFPCVVKPADGHGGEGVLIVNNKEELENAVKSYASDWFLVQKIASHKGRDLRVYVMGNEILAGALRSSDMDFRSNFSLGGKASIYDISESERNMINKVISLFDFSYAGIDFIFDNGIMKLNEIEDVVGARMLYELTDLEPHKLYIDYIITKMRSA